MHSQELTEHNLIFGASAQAEGRNVLERLRAFEALCPFPIGVAADLGCGQGSYVSELAKRFVRVVGIDAQPEALDLARRSAPSNAEFHCSPLENLPLGPETVDAAFLVEVLDHVNSLDSSLAELRRVLKPGSKAYLSVPNAVFPLETHPVRICGRFFHPWTLPLLNWTPFHDVFATARIFRKGKLSRLVESTGFRVVASDYLISPLEFRFKFMRPFFGAMGKTPFKPLIGVSLVFVIEKK